MALHMLHKDTARHDVPLGLITLVGSGATHTRDAANQFSISLPTAATTYRLMIPLNIVPFRVFSGVAGSANLVGFRIKALELWYSIGAVDLSVNTITLAAERAIGAAARAASTTIGGTLSYVTDDGAATAFATVQRANLYKTVVTLGTPYAPDSEVGNATAEWTLTTGAATGTAKVHGVTLRGDYGLHG